jgi:DNA polymerase-1
MLNALQKEVDSDFMACVFDAPGPTFRHTIYSEYKAHRSPMPEDLRVQIDPIHRMVKLMGWQVLSIPSIEADDVIGTLARLGAEQGLQVVVSSSDKDLAQLVNQQITIMDTMSGKKRDIAGVHTEFGVPPSLMLDYQTLVGDPVDNVPGVTKVGPKTAVKWLTTYGSLDNLLLHAEDIKGSIGLQLQRAIDWLPTGRRLLQIKTDCDTLPELLEVLPSLPELIDLKPREVDDKALATFYQEMGFTSLLRKHRHPSTQQPTMDLDLFTADTALEQGNPSLQYTTLFTRSQFNTWLAKIESADLVAIDTETTSLDQMEARLVGISFATQVGEAAYIPLCHDYTDVPPQLKLDEVLAKLKPWLEDKQKAKLGQHIKYDQHIFANHGIYVQGYIHDTMLQSYVLEVHRPHNLASLAKRHLHRESISYTDLCGKGSQQIPFSQVDITQASTYACEDADQTLTLHYKMWPEITKNKGFLAIYELEIATSQVLFTIERSGVHIDKDTLATQGHTLNTQLVALEKKAHELASQPFNLASPKQIGEILYTQQKLPILKKTPKGEPSTSEEVLEKLALDYPLPATILQYRSLAKLKNTYVDKLPQLVRQDTGRVHTHYAQAVVVTGRLASSDPNLQNIPIRTKVGRRVREAFIASPHHKIVSIDYSQIELRIMAHLSEDTTLLQAFQQQQDIHRATAAEIFAINTDGVTQEQRRYAKTINFGLIYGMGTFGLAKSLGIDNQAAKNYITRYFERYPGVKCYMDTTRETAKTQGYVETIFGRRLYLPEINAANGPRRAGAERAAINAPMQGTAADLIKMSMVAVQKALNQKNKKTQIIMQVHDELVFEVPEAESDWVCTEIPKMMCEVATLKVPLVAEVGMGNNWEEAH